MLEPSSRSETTAVSAFQSLLQYTVTCESGVFWSDHRSSTVVVAGAAWDWACWVGLGVRWKAKAGWGSRAVAAGRQKKLSMDIDGGQAKASCLRRSSPPCTRSMEPTELRVKKCAELLLPCSRCNELKPLGAFSKKQLRNWTGRRCSTCAGDLACCSRCGLWKSVVSFPKTERRRLEGSQRCAACLNQLATGYECCSCGEKKPLCQFAKAQRAAADGARTCQGCAARQRLKQERALAARAETAVPTPGRSHSTIARAVAGREADRAASALVSSIDL